MLFISGKYSFKPGIWSTLAVVLLVPLFAALTYWQLQRAAEKQSITAQRAEAELRAPIAISGRETVSDLHLKKVQVSCKLDAQRQLLLDNRIYRQRAGYEALTVCTLENNTAVLINRGWVAPGYSRQQLPDISIAHQYTNAHQVVLNGYFAVPGKGFSLGEALSETPGISGVEWPRRVQYYDYQAIGELLSLTLMPGVVYIDPESPLVLIYNWRPIAFGPEKHYGYALQWFALMITLLVLYSVLNSKRQENL